jgi:UDP-N-acetylmuramoylalanine--D-glutamate ligase
MDFALIGFGVSNRSVLRFIIEKKLGSVFISEKNALSDSDKKFFIENGVEFEEYGNTKKVLDAKIIIYSPSVRPDDPIVKDAVDEGRAVGEIEFASRYVLNGSKIVAVTGSNGKTTTVSLIDHILKTANIDHFTGGNIGTAASDRRNESISILEISSFQLMGTKNFLPDIGAILNISPNHLDWHLNLKEYVDAKMKLSGSKKFIYNSDSDLIPKVHGIKVSKSNGDVLVDEKGFKIGQTYFSIEGSKLFGIHNIYNAAFAAFISKLLGVSDEKITEGLKTFSPLEHRQEIFAVLDGITYVNDSKSTTSESTLKALDDFKGSIVIICGRPKEKDYSTLADGLRKKSKAVIIMGEIAPLIEPLIQDVKYSKVTSMKEAVFAARKEAKIGDVVLLSPAATSFDMFKDYQDRGKTFKRIVLDGNINA